MGYYDNCRPDQRFSSGGRTLGDTDGIVCIVRDWDERRTISVETSKQGLDDDDNDFFFDALAKHINSLPADTVTIDVSPDGELLSTSSTVSDDRTEVPTYFSRSNYLQEMPTIRRPDLTELERLGVQTDLVTYQAGHDRRLVVFKYYLAPRNFGVVWHEAHCLFRIPAHPHIVSFDSIVVDSVDGGDDKVVGFATKFIPGGTVLDNVGRVFKLKYFKQLLETVDYLNLKLGIVHGDICLWNLLIDEEADNLVVFDFNYGAKLGREGDPRFAYNPHRNDVKCTILTLYELITRDLHYREELEPEEVDISEVLDLEEDEEWEPHPDVRLDAPQAEYLAMLNEWVERRKSTDKEVSHYTQAIEYIDWPNVPPLPEVKYFGSLMRVHGRLRQCLVEEGEKFLEWQRPPSRALPLPKGKRLLATGEVVDDVQS